MARYRAEAPEPVDAAFISVDPGILQMRSPTGAPVSAGRGIRSRFDTPGTLAAQYVVTALGTVIVYDATGRIVSRVVEPSFAELRAGFREAGVQ
jgi:hypothetical protein